ncbi:MAG: helix-turn-helix transcriptional regulator [Betaproteobacteria bacterium]|nr:helix-turn-helix transcriptional regulator [Betaproteobacteria bacterium]
MRRVVPTLFPSDPLLKDAAMFGAAIRAARTGAGMTLVDAAMTLGISKQTLSNLEKASGSVGLSIALKVARELGVAVFAAPAGDREPVRRIIINARKTGSGEGKK